MTMKPLNLRDPLFILIIICLIFFILWQRSEGRRQQAERVADNQINQERVKILQDQSAVSEAKIQALERDRKIYRDSARTQQRARMEEIQAFKVTIAKLKVKVAPEIESSPDLSALFSTQDSVIRKQDNLIDSLQIAHSAEIVNMTAQLEEKGNQIMIEQLKTKLWRESVQGAEKEANQQRRRKGFWRTTAAVVTGIALFLAVK